jgi:mannonate dehydratase
MQLSLVLPPEEDRRWDMAKQVGVEDAVVHTLEVGNGKTLPHEYDPLLRMRNAFRDAGLSLSVIEGCAPVTDTTRLGLAGRDEEIERFKTFLRNCGALGIPVVSYDWMAGLRWARTSVTVRSRGESLVTEYDDDDMRKGPPPAIARNTTRADLWANLEYFLGEVVPVAKEAGVKLGLHPDDPPRPDVRGMPRMIDSPEAYDRVLNIHESEHNGLTLCQGNFAAMGVDIPETIRRFGDRINYVHFRDVEGDADAFVETWHDAGPTDMGAAMDAYADVGFEGPARPDHVPTMVGEDNSNPGYHFRGRLFAIGYMRGLLEGAPYSSD